MSESTVAKQVVEQAESNGMEIVHGKNGTPLGATRRASKPRRAAKVTKAESKPASKGGASPQRAKVLSELGKKEGTLASLVKRTKLPQRAVYHHLWHLRKDGLAKSVDSYVEEGLSELTFSLTAKGQRAAAK